MANFQRLIFAALVLLLSWLPGSSFAFPPSTSYRVQLDQGGDPGTGSGQLSACSMAVMAWIYVNYYGGSAHGNNPRLLSGACRGDQVRNSDSVVIGTLTGSITSTSGCAAHATLAAGNCTCTSPDWFESQLAPGTCLASSDAADERRLLSACAAKSGTKWGGGDGAISAPYDAVSGLGANSKYSHLCDPGSASAPSYCGMTVNWSMAAGGVKVGTATYNGYACATNSSGDGANLGGEAPLDSALEKPNTCPPGSVPGTLMGNSVCSPASDQNVVMADAPITTASAPGGAASAPGGTLIPGAPVGTVSKSSTTSCSAGVCNVTTTYKDGAGNTTGTTTETVPVADFCKDNPKSQMCAGPGSYTGSCGAAPGCSGDAIQCAQAQYAQETSCALKVLKPDAGAESALYDTEKVKTGNQTTGLPGNSTVDISAGSFDQTELLGAAGGVDDVSISVMGQSTTLNFSSLNVWLARLGVILQALTFLTCVKIVTRE